MQWELKIKKYKWKIEPKIEVETRKAIELEIVIKDITIGLSHTFVSLI